MTIPHALTPRVRHFQEGFAEGRKKRLACINATVPSVLMAQVCTRPTEAMGGGERVNVMGL